MYKTLKAQLEALQSEQSDWGKYYDDERNFDESMFKKDLSTLISKASSQFPENIPQYTEVWEMLSARQDYSGIQKNWMDVNKKYEAFKESLKQLRSRL